MSGFVSVGDGGAGRGLSCTLIVVLFVWRYMRPVVHMPDVYHAVSALGTAILCAFDMHLDI